MTHRPVDRRVRRTKARLKAALMELIEEVGYEAITIGDLAERADVGRSTFYSHYGSKEDLLFDGFDRWLLSLADGGPADGSEDEIADPVDGGSAPDRFRFSLPLLEHARGQKRFFRATIADSPDPRVRRRTVEILAEVVRRELGRQTGPRVDASRSSGGTFKPSMASDATAHAVVGAFLGLLSWWLNDAEWLEAGEVDEVFQWFATPTPKSSPYCPL